MKSLILSFILFSTTVNVFSQIEVTRKKHFNLKKDIALHGYDPVSYFFGKPKQGDNKISYSHRGVTYLFSSATNLEEFIKDPARFEPQYGGWCAYAIGESGKKVKIDPNTYKIKNDRLYLFYNFNGYNTLEEWNKDEVKLKAAADERWESLYN